MEFGSFDGVIDDDHNGVGLVKISKISVTQDDFFMEGYHLTKFSRPVKNSKLITSVDPDTYNLGRLACFLCHPYLSWGK